MIIPFINKYNLITSINMFIMPIGPPSTALADPHWSTSSVQAAVHQRRTKTKRDSSALCRCLWEHVAGASQPGSVQEVIEKKDI